MSRFLVFVPMAAVVFACAEGSNFPLGEGGAGGDGGASQGKTTAYTAAAVTSGGTTSQTSATTGVTTGQTTAVTTGPTTTATTANTAAATTSSGMMMCGPFELPCGDGTCFILFGLCDGLPDCANGTDEDPSQCGASVPPEWTCSASYYDALDGCDCGCGATDPDCADGTVGSCDYCDDAGSCSTTACPGTIDPANNALCI